MNSKILCGLMVAMMSTGAFAGVANIVTLTDANSSASISMDTSAGMYNWQIDGVNQLAQQWFWYRVGSTGGESDIGSLELLGFVVSNTNFDSGDDTLTILHGGDGFTIETKFSLLGGSAGSGVADIAEQIKITNTGDGVLDFHYFQYSDFDLGGTAGGDTVSLVGGDKWVQSGGGATISETVVTPEPSRFMAGSAAGLLSSLNDASPTNFGNVSSAGPGDVAWAWQWDFSIGIGGSVTISKDKNFVVPAPGAFVLGAMGLGLVGWVRRRYS